MGPFPGLPRSQSNTDARCGVRVPINCRTSSSWRGRTIAQATRMAHQKAAHKVSNCLEGLLKSFFAQHRFAAARDREVTVFRLTREQVRAIGGYLDALPFSAQDLLIGREIL